MRSRPTRTRNCEGKDNVCIDRLGLNGHRYYLIQEEPNKDLKFNYGLLTLYPNVHTGGSLEHRLNTNMWETYNLSFAFRFLICKRESKDASSTYHYRCPAYRVSLPCDPL